VASFVSAASASTEAGEAEITLAARLDFLGVNAAGAAGVAGIQGRGGGKLAASW